MVSCGFAIHEDEFWPVLLTQEYDNRVNEVTEVILDCHSAIYFMEISYEVS